MTRASFYQTTLTNADFSNAIITDAEFGGVVSKGFTKEQLYSTANYKNKDLQGVDLRENDLTGWNFANQNLTNADFYLTTLTGSDFTNAIIKGVVFEGTGFTKEQLYSTASYKNKDLQGVFLYGYDLTGWDFSNQNLTHAGFGRTTLEGVDFTDSIINGVLFDASITKEQLYSTASYKNKDLRGIMIYSQDFTGFDFTNQNLTNSMFGGTFTNVNFTGADLRGTSINISSGTPIYKNTILSDGTITNFSMTSSADNFSIRAYVPFSEGGEMISAKIAENATIAGDATLTLESGAQLDITNNSVLSVGKEASLVINTDEKSSTFIKVESGSGITFESGAKLEINLGSLVGDFELNLIQVNDATALADLLATLKSDDTTSVFSNEQKVYGWTLNQGTGDYSSWIVLSGTVAVPEPAEWAVIFGAVALGFVAYHRRKK